MPLKTNKSRTGVATKSVTSGQQQETSGQESQAEIQNFRESQPETASSLAVAGSQSTRVFNSRGQRGAQGSTQRTQTPFAAGISSTPQSVAQATDFGDVQSVSQARQAASETRKRVGSALERGTGVMGSASASRGNVRGRSRRGTGGINPTQSAVAPEQATPPDPAYTGYPDDFVRQFGLYLLRPEILAVYDFDAMLDGDELTSAGEFQRVQNAAAKSLQERAYRATRDLLSRYTYLPSFGYSAEAARELVPVNQIESEGISLFEQAVSKWDQDAQSVETFESVARVKALNSQNVSSCLDIVNLSSDSWTNNTGFITLGSIIARNSTALAQRPTSAAYEEQGVLFDRHSYLRDQTDTPASVITSLLSYGGGDASFGLDVKFTSYSLMHTLLSNSFVSFAFGSVRKSLSSVTRTRQESENGNTFNYSFRQDETGGISSKTLLTSARKFADDVLTLNATHRDVDVPRTILLQLSSLSSFRGSALYVDSDTPAMQVFMNLLGAPARIGNAPASALESSALAPQGSVADLLFQIPSGPRSTRAVFFDRSHGPGLPARYEHGYTYLFGSTSTGSDVANDLISRCNAAINQIDLLDSQLLSAVAIRSQTSDVRSADVSYFLLQRYADLLEGKWEESGQAAHSSEYAITGLKREYERALKYAGDGPIANAVNASERELVANFADRSRAGSDPRFVPVYVDPEILQLLTLNVPYHGELLSWAKGAVAELMRYFDESVDFFTGARTTAPSPISASIYGDDRTSLKRNLGSFYGASATQNASRIFSLDVHGASAMDRIAKWCISAVRSIFPLEEGFSDSEQIAESRVAALTSVRGPNKSYTFKELCLLCLAFASYMTYNLLTRSSWRDSSNPYMRFKDDATDTLTRVVSYVPACYDDARVSMGVVKSQLGVIVEGLGQMVSQTTAAGSSFVGGQFDMINTPLQAAGISLRRAEFLSRSARDPFTSYRYDVVSSSNILRMIGLNSLYKTQLMRQEDTRVLVVGLPAGITHVVGTSERFVKITVRRRDQSGESVSYEPVTHIFDTHAFFSIEACQAAQQFPWSVFRAFDSIDTITQVSLARLDFTSGTSQKFGNLSFVEAPSVSMPYLTSPDLSGESESEKVVISDFTVDCEFIGASVAARELGASVDQLTTSPLLAGSHVVDYFLKQHILSQSGMDLFEAAFTTSGTAFEPDPTATTDEFRQYILNLCTLQLARPGREQDSYAFSADVRAIDIVSRTPIIKSSDYADLCVKPTIFDRVFAFPINLRQFRRTTS